MKRLIAVFATLPFLLFASSDYEQKKLEISQKYSGLKPTQWGMYIPGVKTRIKTDKKIIALTFDACGGRGGKKYDRDLIEYLKSNNIPATLFVTSSWIKDNTAIFKDLLKEPLFDLQNHGYNHKPASVTGASAWNIKGTLNPADCFDEVEKSAREFETLAGRRPKFYRAGTAYYDDVAVKIIYETGQSPMNFSGVIGDADPQLSLETVKKFIRQNIKEGAILIMHFNHPGGKTYPALKTMIPEMILKGYSFVRLSDVSDKIE
jgi:peptidoglycan/xylan/chitin deacetylase (PgdA/CDA1 family)